MAEQKNIEMLKNLIQETLEKMTFSDFTIGLKEESGPDGENLYFNISSQESDLLIGQHGANLRAFQHIIRAMARKKTEEKLRFSVDVNNYRKEKEGSLEELARSLAKQAADEKRPIVMRPMSAYERRIVHLTLSENTLVQTESIGEGEDRKVVIRPIGSIEQNGNPQAFLG
jgi:spoIIIJ-associated protein